MYLTFGLSDLH